jgi:hypothetical protein
MRRSCFAVATLHCLVVAGVNHGYKVSAAGKFTPSDRSSQVKSILFTRLSLNHRTKFGVRQGQLSLAN